MFLRAFIASHKRSSRQLSSPDSQFQTTCGWFGYFGFQRIIRRKGNHDHPFEVLMDLDLFRNIFGERTPTLCAIRGYDAYSKPALDFVGAGTTLLMRTYTADELFTLSDEPCCTVVLPKLYHDGHWECSGYFPHSRGERLGEVLLLRLQVGSNSTIIATYR